MKDVDILKDILEYRISNELFYNQNLIHIRNPRARQLFAQMRDDEMREIIRLQEKIERLQSKPYIISKIFPIKQKY
ncbi:MAG: PA2169 family four-helix-bundle protein [Maledivibacter sp.]|jgi:rubrerythrin|nr:PA2169 family four-helix-bundle protein [Maledivibacter sp.]